MFGRLPTIAGAGIAGPSRICIVGPSYGGYAALARAAGPPGEGSDPPDPRQGRCRGAGPQEFLELKGEDHWLSFGETRTEMLRRSIEFIDRHIGRPEG